MEEIKMKEKNHDILFYVTLIGIGFIIPVILIFIADILLMRVTNCNVIVSSIFAVLCGLVIFKTCIQVLACIFSYTAKKIEKENNK